MKFKKWYFILGAILAIVVITIILSFTAFSLKSVSIDFRTSSSNITQSVSEKEIIESGKFKMGKPVFFQNKKQYSKNIENFNPYIKVVNIETIFPSKLVVHIAERQEVYAVKGKAIVNESEQDCFYICDEHLRVLRIVYEDNFLSTFDNQILIENKTVKHYKEGEYIKEIRKPFIYEALYENNRFLGEQQSFIEKLSLTKEYDEMLKKDLNVTVLKLFSGQTFKIVNDSQSLKYKAKLMLDVFSQIHEFAGKDYKIGEKTEDGKRYEMFVTLTKEYLSSCTIVVTNYYNYKVEFEFGAYKDCYFKFDLNEDNAEDNGLNVDYRLIEKTYK